MKRKQKNIKYIREKNHYRNGGYSLDFIEVSSYLNKEDFNNVIKKAVEINLNRQSKKYKINFEAYDFTMSFSEYGFHKDLTEIRYKIKGIISE